MVRRRQRMMYDKEQAQAVIVVTTYGSSLKNYRQSSTSSLDFLTMEGFKTTTTFTNSLHKAGAEFTVELGVNFQTETIVLGFMVQAKILMIRVLALDKPPQINSMYSFIEGPLGYSYLHDRVILLCQLAFIT